MAETGGTHAYEDFPPFCCYFYHDDRTREYRKAASFEFEAEMEARGMRVFEEMLGERVGKP
jgi:hypothetical protein